MMDVHAVSVGVSVGQGRGKAGGGGEGMQGERQTNAEMQQRPGLGSAQSIEQSP